MQSGAEEKMTASVHYAVQCRLAGSQQFIDRDRLEGGPSQTVAAAGSSASRPNNMSDNLQVAGLISGRRLSIKSPCSLLLFRFESLPTDMHISLEPVRGIHNHPPIGYNCRQKYFKHVSIFSMHSQICIP